MEKIKIKKCYKTKKQNRERFTHIKSSFFEKNNELTRLMIKKMKYTTSKCTRS